MRGARLAPVIAVAAVTLAPLGCGWIDPQVGPLQSTSATTCPADDDRLFTTTDATAPAPCTPAVGDAATGAPDAQWNEAGGDAGFDSSPE